MARAAATGVIDYSKADPDDGWWHRRHRWLLDELEDQYMREAAALEHQHWVTMTAGWLTKESFEQAQTSATTVMNKWFKLQLPWLADSLGDAGTKTQAEQLANTYHEIYGYPGEERYEQMLKDLAHDLRPLTQIDKIRARRLRRMRQQQEQLEAEAARLGVPTGDGA